VIDIAEVGRCPEKVEPPYTIGEELTCNKLPCLTVGETLEQRNGFLRFLLGRLLVGFFLIVLMDISQLCSVDMFRLFGFLIPLKPEEYPNESERTDNDEGTFPSPCLGDERNGGRGSQSAYRCTTVEDGSGQSAVLFREILCSHLDGRGEVARLADGENHAACQEEIDRYGGDGQCQCRSFLHGVQGLHTVKSLDLHGQPAASCMEAGACRPDEDGQKITFLCTQPVNGRSGKEAHGSIEQREPAGDHAVVRVSPVKLRRDEVLPCQREHLAVEIVDRSGHKEERTEIPSPVCLHLVFDIFSVHARCFLAF